MKLAIRFLLLLSIDLAAWTLPAAAQSAQSSVPRTLRQLSLEDLMSIEITSASRKEQRAADVAGGIFVITQEDIRRSGMTTIPDVLRMAPGVDVAQISASKWAVSVRGFNSVYADKLLVLIDGRTIYDRIFSGVIWDAQDLMLDDVDRIEVIRGPGAAIWGANAVNAVINIVTKPATETHGGLARVDGGGPGAQAAVRYGGIAGDTDYRVYTQWTTRDSTLLAPGKSAGDGARGITAGFRTDWSSQPDALTLEGAFTADQTHALWANLDPATAGVDPFSRALSEAYTGHVLGRWKRARPDGALLQIQSVVDLTKRDEPIATYERQTIDLDTQYHKSFGTRHDLVAGAGYRHIGDRYTGKVGIVITPAKEQSSLVTAFLQDEIALARNRLAVMLGAQAQYDTETGGGLQPTARVMWKGLPRQHLWAAASRALRTPSRYERGVRVDFPVAAGPGGVPMFVSALGNPAAKTETVIDVEGGYRLDAGRGFSIDLTGFVARYGHLQTQELQPTVLVPGLPPRLLVSSQFGNSLEATTRGVEVAARWMPVKIWHVDASYTGFHFTPDPAATSRDTDAMHADGSAPRTQWQVRSTWTLGPRATLYAALFHVGRLDSLVVPAYTRADVTAEWRFSQHLSAMLIGQNLLAPAHREFDASSFLTMATQIPRGVSVRLRWAF